jgi:hypothetical protein
LRIVNSMYDDCYTKEHAINALKSVIRGLDKSELNIYYIKSLHNVRQTFWFTQRLQKIAPKFLYQG